LGGKNRYKKIHFDQMNFIRQILPLVFIFLYGNAIPEGDAACASRRVNQIKWDLFLDTLQERTIKWFLDVTPKNTGLTPDRWPTSSPSSIGAVGFALTAYPIAAKRQIISREDAAQRTITTMRFLWQLPQDKTRSDIAGYKGFFYHFIDTQTGLRVWNCELSTIDTGLLIAGALFCQSYFNKNDKIENEIRQLSDSLYQRIDWKWAMGDTSGIWMGWTPEGGWSPLTWFGYNEAMILYILALGSPTNSVPATVWEHWTAPYDWKEHCGTEYLNFGPMFGYQYSHLWIDFRGIQDAYMRAKGIDYFENSRRATYANRTYATENRCGWRDYSDSIWGLTACDGPKDTTFILEGKTRKFQTYSARGSSVSWVNDDGTLSPTAPGGSLPFAPEICIPVLKAMRNKYGEKLWTKYGFVDAFNPSYITEKTQIGWFDNDYLGIDQGPIAIMIENLRNGFVWEVMKKNPYIIEGLKRAGFSGDWLINAMNKK
jgi:hypothetical protein